MNRAPLFLLYLNVLVVATCGLIYELLAGTLASYVLGDSVTQFSFVIGVYLFALGIGAWLSRWVKDREAERFIRPVAVEVNRLDNQALVRYYEREWGRWD